MPGAIPNYMLSVGILDSKVLYDTFVGTNGADLSGRVPEITIGGNWYVGLGTWDIQSNAARHGSVNDDGVLVSTGIGANLRVMISRVTANAENFTGFCFRYSDSDNYLIAGADAFNGAWRIWKNVAGAFTQIGTASDSDVPTGGDTIINMELQISTLNIVVYEDGIERVRSTGDSFNDGADGIGLYADPLSATDSIFDDISVWLLNDGIEY